MAYINGKQIMNVGITYGDIDTELSATSKNAVANSAVANNVAPALKGTASGAVVTVSDVSPVEHTAKAWVHGKNLFVTDISRYDRPSSYFLCPIELKKGQKYCISGSIVGEAIPNITVAVIEHGEHYEEFVSVMHTLIWADSGLISPVTFEVDGNWTSPKLAIYPTADKDSISQIFNNYNLQLEEGDTATEYTPYIDPSTVTVTEETTGATYTPDDNGVCNVVSVSPTMTLLTDTDGVRIDVEYNRDINAVIADIYSKLT